MPRPFGRSTARPRRPGRTPAGWGSVRGAARGPPPSVTAGWRARDRPPVKVKDLARLGRQGPRPFHQAAGIRLLPPVKASSGARPRFLIRPHRGRCPATTSCLSAPTRGWTRSRNRGSPPGRLLDGTVVRAGPPNRRGSSSSSTRTTSQPRSVYRLPPASELLKASDGVQMTVPADRLQRTRRWRRVSRVLLVAGADTLRRTQERNPRETEDTESRCSGRSPRHRHPPDPLDESDEVVVHVDPVGRHRGEAAGLRDRRRRCRSTGRSAPACRIAPPGGQRHRLAGDAEPRSRMSRFWDTAPHTRTAELTYVTRCGVRPRRRTAASQAASGSVVHVPGRGRRVPPNQPAQTATACSTNISGAARPSRDRLARTICTGTAPGAQKTAAGTRWNPHRGRSSVFSPGRRGLRSPGTSTAHAQMVPCRSPRSRISWLPLVCSGNRSRSP